MDEYGIADELLMENAGLAVFQIVRKNRCEGQALSGVFRAGNNGGDGFVVARKIHSNGGLVKVYLLGNPEKYQGAARLNFDILGKLPVVVQPLESADAAKADIFHCDAVVDAIFGTGLVRDVEGKYADIVDLINASRKPVVSVDIPSGVNGDDGRVMGVAVHADWTVTFGLPKIGAMLYPGYERCGELFVTHISFPPAMYDSLKVQVNDPVALPPRNANGHKGTFGQALFIAGAAGYYGAPYFAAMSFLKAGGGYSRLAVPKSVAPFIASQGSEIVFVPQKETSAGSLSIDNKDALLSLASKMDFVVLGPGISLEEETQQLARELAENVQVPLLLDGDGITAAADNLQIVKRRRAPTILTPHLGEMSRIMKMGVRQIEDNQVAVLQRACAELGAIIVLKGAHSLIGYPDGDVFINMSGNAGMATAGSGDVLAGTVAAMHGLGLGAEEAVRKGVFIHGFAGDLAAEEIGEDGMTAKDILEFLPLALELDREGLDEDLRELYSGAKVV